MSEDQAWVIVPAYNESAVIGDVVRRLCEAFPRVLCVDDGSSDGSGDVARRAGATVVRHPVNLGQGAALQTGFDYVLHRTDATHVITFDGDGQHSVTDALTMLSVARVSGVQVVLGTRHGVATVGQPWSRRLLLRLGLLLSRRLSGLDLTDTHNGLRVLSRDTLTNLRLTQRGMAHASELEALVSRHRLTWMEQPVTVHYTDYSRAKGQGSINAFNIVYDLLTARLRLSA